MSAEILAAIEQVRTLTEQYQNQSQEDRDRLTTGLSKIDDFLQEGVRNVYIDVELGSDDNDGAEINSPVKTLAKAAERFDGPGLLIITALAPTVFDYSHLFGVKPDAILLQTLSRDGQAANHEIIFKDAINHPSRVGGFVSYGMLNVFFLRAPCTMDYSRSFPVVYSFYDRVTVRFSSSPLKKTGTSSFAFMLGQSYHVTRSSSVFDPSASGFIINGVAAGANPNDSSLVFYANFTQG